MLAGLRELGQGCLPPSLARDGGAGPCARSLAAASPHQRLPHRSLLLGLVLASQTLLSLFPARLNLDLHLTHLNTSGV